MQTDIRVSAKDTLYVYWEQVRRHKLLVFFMFLALGVSSALELATPLFYRRFFNLLSGDLGLPAPALPAALIKTLLFILATNGAAWLVFRSTTFMNDFFQPRIIADLTQRAFDHLQRHSYGFFANNFVGSLVRRVGRLGRSFETFADRIYWNLFPLAIRVVVTIAVLWHFNHTVAALMTGWAVLFMFFNYLFSRWKLKYDTARAAKDTESVGVLADALTNANNIQLFNGYGFEFARLKKVTEELRRLRMFTWNLGSVIEAAQAALAIAAEFLLMYFGLKFWLRGELTAGDLVLIQSYLFGLIGQLWNFGRNIRDIYESFADAEDMVRFLKMPHEIQDARGATPLRVRAGGIDFLKINFSFHQTRQVLHDFTFAISPGEKVALIGPSGAGKSTVVKLLLRLYDPDDGKILIDRQPIQKITLESLRGAVALVPQEPIIFHRSIRENIRYGQQSASHKDVERAAAQAHCTEFIRDLPRGWDTLVGERGIKLSGGERQRVAIARAILKDAPILVLDEATSSLDSRSEALIQDALGNLMKNKTVMVIAHRLSTIRKMDRIVVMQNGRVIDEGTHAELTNRDSLYRDLWRLQAGGFLPTSGTIT